MDELHPEVRTALTKILHHMESEGGSYHTGIDWYLASTSSNLLRPVFDGCVTSGEVIKLEIFTAQLPDPLSGNLLIKHFVREVLIKHLQAFFKLNMTGSDLSQSARHADVITDTRQTMSELSG